MKQVYTSCGICTTEVLYTIQDACLSLHDERIMSFQTMVSYSIVQLVLGR